MCVLQVHQGLSRAETLATKAIRLQEELQEVAKQQEATVTMIDKEKTYQRKVCGWFVTESMLQLHSI